MFSKIQKKTGLVVSVLLAVQATLFGAAQDLKGGSGTNIDYYCAEFTQEIVDNLRNIHGSWDTGWNKYMTVTFGNSISADGNHWNPLGSDVTDISNAAEINAFMDSTFAQGSWITTTKVAQAGQTIKWVANQVSSALSGKRPMIAAIMIGTNNIQMNHLSYPECSQALDCYPDTFEYKEIIEPLMAAGVIPIITTIPPIDYAHSSWIRENRKDKETTYNDKLRTLARNHKLPLVDLHKWCEDHGGASELLYDWAHAKGCDDGNTSFSDNCLDGGASGGLQNARNYMLVMAINDIVRYVVDGEDPQADVTPPAAISDLSASSGIYTGTVDLSWIASGNNAGTGIAYEYDIRFSASPISESNFASATRITNVPLPGISGSAESLTVLGLTPGADHYFAIKVSDRYNWSDISNTVQARAASTTLRDDSMRVNVTEDTFLEAGGSQITGGLNYIRLKGANQGVIMLKFDLSTLNFFPDSAAVVLKPGSTATGNFSYIVMVRDVRVDWNETTIWTGSSTALNLNIGSSSAQNMAGSYTGTPVPGSELRFGIGKSLIQSYARGEATGIALIDIGPSGLNNDFCSKERGTDLVPYMMVYIKSTADIRENTVTENLNHQTVLVSPNPFSTSVFFEIRKTKSEPRNIHLCIYDIAGKLVYEFDQRGSHSAFRNSGYAWHAQDHPAGIYVLEVGAGNSLARRKIILLK
jgi:hypothetical protein